MRYLIITGFVLMVGAQWYAPLSMVFDSQSTVDEGVEYRFKTAPVDPSDPFRGKYITLNFDAETYYPADTNETHFEPNQKVYALLRPDSAGYAEIVHLTAEPPTAGLDYIEVTFEYTSRPMTFPIGPAEDPSIVLTFPFRRFYLEESKASEAEQLNWSTGRDTTAVCYAKVSVHEGKSSLTDVMIGDKSIVDVIREMNASKD
jgi:uncharacterized membrane-anchored protein